MHMRNTPIWQSSLMKVDDTTDLNMYITTDSGRHVLIVVLRLSASLNKDREWFSRCWFKARSGRSRASISKAVASLVTRGLVAFQDESGRPMHSVYLRQAHRCRFFLSVDEALSHPQAWSLKRPSYQDSRIQKDNYLPGEDTYIQGNGRSSTTKLSIEPKREPSLNGYLSLNDLEE